MLSKKKNTSGAKKAKKVKANAKLEKKVKAVIVQTKNEDAQRNRAQSEQTEINRQAATAIRRYQEHQNYLEKQGVKHKLLRLLSLSHEENKRINQEGLLFDFGEAERFGAMFKVLIEFLLDPKIASRFDEKFGGKVADMPSMLIRLKDFFESLDSVPVEAELALMDLEPFGGYSTEQATKIIARYQKLRLQRIAEQAA